MCKGCDNWPDCGGCSRCYIAFRIVLDGIVLDGIKGIKDELITPVLDLKAESNADICSCETTDKDQCPIHRL
jgi:hypothetical protein